MSNIASPEMVTAAWVLVILYMAVILFFVIRGAKKTKSIEDYALGSVAFSPVAVGLALAASMTSAATFIINPGFIAMYGLSSVISYILVLPSAAIISLIVLTKGFRKHGTTVKALTMAQWIGTRYKSKGYALFFAFLSLLLITFIVLICVGLTKILSKSLNVGEFYILLGIVIFIFGYMMFGGANSMVYTNTVQALIMVVVAFILLGSGYEHFSEGVHGFIDKLRAIDPKLVQTTNESSFLFRDYFEIIFAQIVIGIAVICQPHILTKSLLLKTDKDVNRYLIAGVVAQSLFFLVIFAGLYARIAFPDLTVNGTPLRLDGILSAYVIRELPVYVGLVVVLGMVSAGLSTLEGLIQSISSTITTDLIKPLFGKHYPKDEQKRATFEIGINKIVIIVLAIISVIVSWDQIINPKLSVAILAQNGVYAYFASAFIPILFGTFLKEVPKKVPIIASVTAIVIHLIFYFGKVAVPFTKSTGENPGVAATVAIVLSVIIGFVIYYIDLKKSGSNLSEQIAK